MEPWLEEDPNLAGTGNFGGEPIGANGIEFHQGTLYVAVSEQFSIVAVPVESDGTPGLSRVVTTFSPVEGLPSAPDGLALDVHGQIYVAVISQSRIVRVDPDDGAQQVIASGDPLDWPSSVAFGTGRGERQTLFVVNFSIGELFGDNTPRFGPARVAINAGVPGDPLP